MKAYHLFFSQKTTKKKIARAVGLSLCMFNINSVSFVNFIRIRVDYQKNHLQQVFSANYFLFFLIWPTGKYICRRSVQSFIQRFQFFICAAMAENHSGKFKELINRRINILVFIINAGQPKREVFPK